MIRAVSGVELALGPDRLQDGRPPLIQFPQVVQALLQGAELGVVQAVRRLLAVAGDEGHGRAAVEQADGGGHLPFPDTELVGDAAGGAGRSGYGHQSIVPRGRARRMMSGSGFRYQGR